MIRKRISMAAFAVFTFVMVNAGCSRQNPPQHAQQAPAQNAEQAAAQELFNRAQTFKNNGELSKARETYQRLFAEHPDFDKIDQVQEELNQVNTRMLFSKTMVEGKTVMHEIKAGDTLGKLAKQYGTTVDLIKRSNGLEKDVIRLGDKLRIWTAPFNIFVDKSQNILMLKTGEEVLKVYTVSTGTDNSTPVGEFKITDKLKNPTWYKSGAVIAPDSPENALGTRWMGFDLKGYGIHGTIEPDKMGQQVTAGCVRMLNEQVEELFEIVPSGTTVTIVD